MADQVSKFLIDPDDPPSKRAIVLAAFKLFVERGFDATNIREIAKEAGYSNPAIFKFFDSKDHLGLYLFERCYMHYAEVFGSEIRPQRSFDENLGGILDSFCETLGHDPGTFLFFQDHLRHFWPMVSAKARKVSILAQVKALIEQGQSEKVVNKDVDSKMLVAAFVGFLTQFARMQYFGEFKGHASQWKGRLKIVSRRLFKG